jgi:hypothetical protein
LISACAQQTGAAPADEATTNPREVVFAARTFIEEHWYANIDRLSTCTPEGGPDAGVPLYGHGGRLAKVDLETGRLTVLVDDPEGSVRDPAVHYNGHTILFSYRKRGTENYLLYTIESDGSNLRQLTQGVENDYEPTWLPDGGIAFVTTRCNRWVQCWLSRVGNIYRCDADGQNMRALSANLEHDNTPNVLPDGRLLYMRWEYVDRSQVNYHHLWTMNPDGTSQAVYYGNYRPSGLYIDARAIPGTDDVVLTASPGHGRAEHLGAIAIVSPARGPDAPESLQVLNAKRGDDHDPYPLSSDAFLVACDRQLVRLDRSGQASTLYTLPEPWGTEVKLHEPRPLVPRPRERIIPNRTQPDATTGRFLLADVAQGRNMKGVSPGDVKRLLVVESLPKPVNFTGGMDPLSYKGTFTLERALGTVPVEADGSAYFEAPAMRSVFFIALDARGRAIKRMRSFTTVQPGETLSCVGCHEHRTEAPGIETLAPPIAGNRPPAQIEPLADVPALPDFTRDIQPVLDRYCARCHNDVERQARLDFTSDHGPMFSHSYYSLTIAGLLADGRNEARSNDPPYQYGSGASGLIKRLEAQKATDADLRLVSLWIDLGAPYPSTYAALGTGTIGGYIQNNQVLNNDTDWPTTRAAQAVFERRCNACHTADSRPIPHTLSDEIGLSFWEPKMDDPRLKSSRHTVFNLTRPERSEILLAPLAKSAGGHGVCRPANTPADSPSAGVFASTDDPDYRLLLALCEGGRDRLSQVKRFDMPGFRPRAEYLREMRRYGILPPDFDPASSPLDRDAHALDDAYWRTHHLKGQDPPPAH